MSDDDITRQRINVRSVAAIRASVAEVNAIDRWSSQAITDKARKHGPALAPVNAPSEFRVTETSGAALTPATPPLFATASAHWVCSASA
jgi:hypothetical protein